MAWLHLDNRPEFAKMSYELVSAMDNQSYFLFEESLTEFPEVLGYNTLGMLGNSEMDTFAEARDLGRRMPLLDNAVDKRFLNDKGMVSRQLASPRTETKCKPQKTIIR